MALKLNYLNMINMIWSHSILFVFRQLPSTAISHAKMVKWDLWLWTCPPYSLNPNFCNLLMDESPTVNSISIGIHSRSITLIWTSQFFMVHWIVLGVWLQIAFRQVHLDRSRLVLDSIAWSFQSWQSPSRISHVLISHFSKPAIASPGDQYHYCPLQNMILLLLRFPKACLGVLISIHDRAHIHNLFPQKHTSQTTQDKTRQGRPPRRWIVIV